MIFPPWDRSAEITLIGMWVLLALIFGFLIWAGLTGHFNAPIVLTTSPQSLSPPS